MRHIYWKHNVIVSNCQVCKHQKSRASTGSAAYSNNKTKYYTRNYKLGKSKKRLGLRTNFLILLIIEGKLKKDNYRIRSATWN